MLKFLYVLLWFLILVAESQAIIGYDCSSSSTNITKISTTSTENCNFRRYKPEVSKEYIQLLQLADITPIHVYQCKYQVDRLITHCGMHSHSSMVRGSFSSFIKEIPREECLNIHRHRSLKTQTGLIIDNIALNGTTKFIDIVAGSINSNAECQGAFYTDGKNEYDSVIVQFSITLVIRDFTASVYASRDTVLIEGLRCDYSAQFCMDSNFGQSFWSHNNNPSCYETTYDVLFDGLATKASIKSPITGLNETIYSVVAGDTIFALQIKGEMDLCSSFGLQTEHPRLFIVPYIQKSKTFVKRPILAKNLDLFIYFNSKFIYTERHLRNELSNLYIDLLTKVCETEKQILETQLAIARVDPNAFAYARTKQPGFTANKLGEMIYLMKCVPAEVEIRKTDQCYNELPVTYKNASYFMTSNNHLLEKHGNVVECTSFMSPAYQLMDVWYNLFPALHKTENPPALKTNSQFTWLYTDPGNLASKGIYSQSDLDGLKKQILFPSEREAITNAMVRKIISPNEIDHQNLNIGNLLDENKLKKMIRNAWDKAFSVFTNFGLVMSTIMGFIFIAKVVKFLLDTIIHAYSLHAIFGWSWQLLSAVYDVLTYYLIRRAEEEPRVSANNLYPDLERAQLHLLPATQLSTLSITNNPAIQQASAPPRDTLVIETEMTITSKNETETKSTADTIFVPYNLVK